MLQSQSFWVFRFWILNARGNLSRVLRSWGSRESEGQEVLGVSVVHETLRCLGSWGPGALCGLWGPGSLGIPGLGPTFQPCPLKNLLLKISDNCQENTSVETSFWGKKDTSVKIFSCECWETFNIYFTVFMDEKFRLTLFRSSHSEKHLCWNLFLINLQIWSSTTWLKRDSNTDIFLWILRNF